jgi:hypothetical protein
VGRWLTGLSLWRSDRQMLVSVFVKCDLPLHCHSLIPSVDMKGHEIWLLNFATELIRCRRGSERSLPFSWRLPA